MAEVVAIRWPEESADALVAAGVAVLYIIGADDDPPVPTGCLEDWVRVPGDDRDFRARLAALELRAALHHAPPFVDDAGRLHYSARVVALSARESRLAAVLIAHLGSVVPDAELLAVLDDGTEPPALALKVEVGRLRSRLRETHLAVRRAPRLRPARF